VDGAGAAGARTRPPRRRARPDPRPAAPPSANQKTANTIAEHLRQSGQLRQYSIDVAFVNGTAELNGVVADQLQREEALRVVQGVPGVGRVLDHLRLAENPIIPVQAAVPAPVPVARRRRCRASRWASTACRPSRRRCSPRRAVAVRRQPAQAAPYAWPTYAPYNNLSRVAYPTAYPYNACRSSGRSTPSRRSRFGWRSVKLEFQDGHWWYSKVACPHDWWRVRYW